MIDKPLIIDASVAIKWVLNENGTDQASDLLNNITEFFEPEIFDIEISAILTKRVRMKELSYDEAITKKSYFTKLPYFKIPLNQIEEKAFDVASKFSFSYYDGLYLASALAYEGRLITADFRLYNGLQNSPFKNLVEKLEY
ncbi:MAG: type II toxin-antitoxin system VapC family toxin [Balneola sp.]